MRASRQRGPPGNEGLPATRASRQRGFPGNESLPATRASQPPGNEGLPATRASRLFWPLRELLREGFRGRPFIRHPYDKTLYGEAPYLETFLRGGPLREHPLHDAFVSWKSQVQRGDTSSSLGIITTVAPQDRQQQTPANSKTTTPKGLCL